MYVDGDRGNSSEGTTKEDLVDCVRVNMENFGLSCEDAKIGINGDWESTENWLYTFT